ncbi:UNVERIFIED_CONTAM: hypothetical protein Sradi_2103800 [Sesamum radiatum]|uniref:Uncharacterized protein n=1 Tax=Sesamum radiatum TaxID=300843 RepID=A0AAW2TII3_SESRA
MALAMETNATIIEELLASLTRVIRGLTEHVEELDAQIAKLINKAVNVDKSHIMGKQVEAHDEAEASTSKPYSKNCELEDVSGLLTIKVPVI